MSDKKKLPMKREFSAGGVVYKEKPKTKNQKPKILWLVGKHSGYHKWVLPKGMIEPGEKGIETAVRETEEEMGVVAKVIGDKPIHKDEYWFVATLDGDEKSKIKNTSIARAKDGKQKSNRPIRRVKAYQENPGFEKDEGDKVRVFKTVTFYLMEYVSGDPNDHDWEMSDARWVDYNEAQELLVFEGEKQALEKARGKLLGSA